jgi:long-chain acyl-CoA synthetase
MSELRTPELGDRNLARAAELALERLGDHESLFFEGRWYRSGEQAERAARIGAGLIELGVQPGDRVIVMMENSPDVPVVYQAIWRAGAAITPAIFLLTADELRRIVSDSGAVAVIAAPPFLDTVEKASEGVDTLRWTITTGDADGDTVTLASLAEHEPGEIVPRANDDLAVLLYTGGTTGASKGVMLTHSNLWQAGWAGHQIRTPGITRGLSCLPMSHSYGVLLLAGALHADEPGRTVLMKWFEPTQWLQLAQDHDVQAAAVVPSMLYMLLQQPLEEYDLSELCFIGSGAAPLAAEAIAELKRRIPNVEVREGYGLTESAASVSAMRPGRIKHGTVGEPVPGCELKIFDEDDHEVPVGEVGEICIRSGSVMKGYWNAPEQTAEALRNGWLHTGDMGRLDQEGFLTIVDRKKDLIIRGGFNVYPRDVEEALLEHPAIATAGVVGRPDSRHGEEVVAFVTLQPGAEADADELVAWAKERLGGYKYPREVHVLPALPLTPVGKLDRKALRENLTTVQGGTR